MRLLAAERRYCLQLCGNTLKSKLNGSFHRCPTSLQFKTKCVRGSCPVHKTQQQSAVLHGLAAQDGQVGELSACLLPWRWPRPALGHGGVSSCPFCIRDVLSLALQVLFCRFKSLFGLSFSSHEEKQGHDRKRT